MVERIGDRWPVVALALIVVGMLLGWAACLAWVKGQLRDSFKEVIYRQGTWWLQLGGRRQDLGRAMDRVRQLPKVPD